MSLARAMLLQSLLTFASITSLAQQNAKSLAIVEAQTLVMTKPPQHVPSGTVVDGPILGNGDVGVVIGGPPDDLRFYIGKNDFWSQQASPMTVGGVQLSIPSLKNATYRVEEDLFRAEARGTFSTPDTTLKTKSWVAATENLVVTELQATGKQSVTVTARLFPKGTAITNNDKHIYIGREQYGDGRSYFNGLIDEIHLYNRALSPGEVSQLANLQEVTQGLLRRWGFDAAEGTTPQDTIVQMITGPPCPGPPAVFRPDERPVDEPTGCLPEGYHLDYQRYGLGKRGRAVKLTHGWNYVDAGEVPPVQQMSLAAWIYTFSSGDANFIVSKGAWNDAYSLSLDHGRLRFSIGERFVRSRNALPTNQWIHVAGTFDGTQLRAYVDGEEVEPPARFIASGEEAGTVWVTRNADGPLDEQYPWPNPIAPTSTTATKGREASFAARVVGSDSSIHDGDIVFSLSPGQPVFLVTPVLSDLDAPNHLAAALERVQTLTPSVMTELYQAHCAWWRDYWSQSFIEMDDPVLEKFYYASQYITASASRSGKVAPGLYGPWVTTDHPSWNGDYTLNYNLETPYLGLYSSNHLATADSYDAPILDFIGRGKTYARTMLNVRGVYYPGHIGPWGLERPFDYEPFMGQKSNAAFLVMPMLMRFYSTYDDAYARKTYPFIKEVGDFWEDYLQMKDGRYVILDDCVGEVGPWLSSPDWAKCPNSTNPMNDLGFVRAVFRGLIDMSVELNVDEARRPLWQNIIDHLAPYPTAEHDGKQVFLAAEPSAAHSNLNSTVPDWGTLAIWPANQIGLGEDSHLLEIALNTVTERGARDHPLVPPAMARVGYDPEKLLAALRANCMKNGYPNGYIFFFGGGVESASMVPATINEMMLQSFSGSLRLFPVWPSNHNASFGNLRAYGAFLVSSTFRNGHVKDLTIFSEKGRDCKLENPWRGRALLLFRNSEKAETLQGASITFKTAVNEAISIQPL